MGECQLTISDRATDTYSRVREEVNGVSQTLFIAACFFVILCVVLLSYWTIKLMGGERGAESRAFDPERGEKDGEATMGRGRWLAQ
jgi:hypothetical protein